MISGSHWLLKTKARIRAGLSGTSPRPRYYYTPPSVYRQGSTKNSLGKPVGGWSARRLLCGQAGVCGLGKSGDEAESARAVGPRAAAVRLVLRRGRWGYKAPGRGVPWEPGMGPGAIPHPRQIWDGDGDGPPESGKSGTRMGMGVHPRPRTNRGWERWRWAVGLQNLMANQSDIHSPWLLESYGRCETNL